MKKFLFLIILLTAASAGGAYYYYSAPGPLTLETSVIIRKGSRSQATIENLAMADVIRFPKLFMLVEYAAGHNKQFKAGEYAFPPGITPKEVSQKLVSGEVVVHKLTIPEGWNVREIRAALMADGVLEGDITLPMEEGTLLPETYYYTYGDTRDAVITRMKQAMDNALESAWQTRKDGLPFQTKQEALILASIVEKETGVEDERARVAAVFINRLRIGMRLQTDPSVIYGIEQLNNAPMTRPLTVADLETPNNYNTYVIPGLPPTPIANPGIEAIEATLHPAETKELYFVATGTGGHRFAETLEQHNNNVAAYRAVLKSQ